MTGKISELTPITGAAVATDDQFEIRDTSAGTSGSKSITVAELRKGVFSKEVLSDSRSYYVRTDGSDSNDGLTNTAGGAWLTLQHAWIWICDHLNMNGCTATINIADGTYGPVDVYDRANHPDFDVLRFPEGSGGIEFSGNRVTPASVVIQATDSVGYCFELSKTSIDVTISGVTFDVNGQYGAVVLGGSIAFIGVLDFRVINAAGVDIFYTYGGSMSIRNCHEIVGSFRTFIYASYATTWMQWGQSLKQLVFTGSPVIGSAFIFADFGAAVQAYSMNHTGTITGKRYSFVTNSLFNSGGVTLPGTVSGTTATGGQVI